MGGLDVYKYVWNHLSPSGNIRLCGGFWLGLGLGLSGMPGMVGLIGLYVVVGVSGFIGLVGISWLFGPTRGFWALWSLGAIRGAWLGGVSGVLTIPVEAAGNCSSRKGCIGKVGIFASLRKATIL